MANDVTNLQNVTQIDDRNGNFYWICDVYHITGTDTDVLVPDNVVGASEITATGARGGNVSVTADDSATDSVREVTIDTGEATGLKKLCIRFAGNPGGMGSGHGVL